MTYKEELESITTLPDQTLHHWYFAHKGFHYLWENPIRDRVSALADNEELANLACKVVEDEIDRRNKERGLNACDKVNALFEQEQELGDISRNTRIAFEAAKLIQLISHHAPSNMIEASLKQLKEI